MVSNLIYYCFIPIGLWLIFFIIVLVLEKYFQIFMPKKLFWLLLTFVIVTLIVIGIVIASLNL
ncbi:hypothetical protein [Spiroplasma alleghenense]|uniref:Uncharacterized protein n=1 Tax=Spiroplasma alleghenense TaxID=216931 RepID=A0A345Z4I8_9MOLU|nr:hypothetical protein [Spiroplasma alleghenense]AXK51517.1 hypothetical protein SALLE_v1c08470 [Spiroplasma alleghenense]